MSFTSFGLHPDLLRGVQEMGFTTPTPIQTQAVPPGLEGRDLLACAMTGSGKTAAFLLPIVQRLLASPGKGTRALILTPTRELAAQIEEHLRGLSKHTRVRGAAIFGGVGMGPQEQALRSGVDIVVATPGRLLDHLKQPYTSFANLEVLVLDEADRMLDMGFLPDIRRVLAHLPKQRQTLFFSATMPAPIAQLADQMLQRPVTINQERKAAPATGITQALYPVREELKAQLFLELLKRGELKDVIVFTRTKHRSNRLYDFLTSHGIRCERIHGNRSQAQRTQALAGFKSGDVQVLVATDIVARGIDVEELSHVVNFDVPHMPEDYIHRVGRTARADATGDAYTFVAPEEEADLRAIEKAVGKRIPRLTLAGFAYDARPTERFEVPLAERIAEIRKRKAEERARAKEKAERKAQRQADEAARVAAKDAQRSARGPRAVPQARPGEADASYASEASQGSGRRRRRGGRNRSASFGR
ncbi:DEAD/DEAH box helicase [Roseisolibacter sp. H3M3-2]|uniref:DEAD/DEAH box helicase n=1 Tax=Roseisolibacter sp. H3M3-2 TaxID=3031323 RepID=UPI0023DA22A8|nr:DEAD/DEAH box helicase [Roseisolibacter sp. H3M3-2]MDF1502616.1 DEAD/DEAH box helicase [Roseisolibacter sp. H3M3-2]